MLPEIRKTRASQARETAAAEKNQQLNTVQTALQTDIATFTRRTASSLKNMFSLQKSQAELERLRAGAELENREKKQEKRKMMINLSMINSKISLDFLYSAWVNDCWNQCVSRELSRTTWVGSKRISSTF